MQEESFDCPFEIIMSDHLPHLLFLSFAAEFVKRA